MDSKRTVKVLYECAFTYTPACSGIKSVKQVEGPSLSPPPTPDETINAYACSHLSCFELKTSCHAWFVFDLFPLQKALVD